MDFYERLGVSKDANSADLKKAYRKLALEHHPDRNQGSKDAELKFRGVTEAYETLRDPEKRARYDGLGAKASNGRRGGHRGFDSSERNPFNQDLGGGLNGAFRSRKSSDADPAHEQLARGEPLRVRVPLTLSDVDRGVTKRIRVSVLNTCGPCDGSGSTEGTGRSTCGKCGGRGEIDMEQPSLFSHSMSASVCPICSGEGSVHEMACSACRGQGRSPREIEIDVEVPPGVTSKHTITLRGRGNVGPGGGPRGDVIAMLDMEEDPDLTRRDADLLVELRTTFARAALGWVFEIPTIHGDVEVLVPPGTQSGQILRIRGEGLPVLGGSGRGDLLVHVTVWTPEELTPEQRDALWDLFTVESPPPKSVSQEDGGLWSRVRAAFRGKRG